MIDRGKLWQEFKRDPERLVGVLKNDPALIDYLLREAELKQKYCKLPKNVESELKEKSKELRLSEAVLIALGVILLFALLSELSRSG
jgi:hypothetical protein